MAKKRSANPAAQREQFCQGIVRGLSQTEAYIAAGYNKRAATQCASRMMKDPAIQKRINEIKDAKIAEVAGGTVQYTTLDRATRVDARTRRWCLLHAIVVKELAENRADPQKMSELRQLEKDVAIERGEWLEKVEHSGNIQLADRLKAARKRLQDAGDKQSG